MLQRIYTAVRSGPELGGVQLVSGPLQRLETNRNAAVHYLRSTYSAGKTWFGWGRGGVPFPFDGVGYQLYVKPGYTNESQQARAVRTACREYLSAMHQVIHQEEGKDKPLFVSEVGWNSRIDPGEFQRREKLQARSLQVGLETICEDRLVGLVFWFCTQDVSLAGGDWFYGLYRPGNLTLTARKTAFYAFKAFCERVEEEEKPPQYTNQQFINAFYYADIDLGLAQRWSLMVKAGLSPSVLAADRQGPYTGKPISELPNLTTVEKAAIQARLDEQSSQVPSAPSAGHAATASLGTDETWDANLRLDLVLGVQE